MRCRSGQTVRADRQQAAPAAPPFWGKSRGLESPYPLAAHLLDAAAASQAVIERILPPGLAKRSADAMGLPVADWAQLAKVLAGWHDCGKASAGFQNQDGAAAPEWLAGCRDAPGAGGHDLKGGRLAWDHLEGRMPDKTRCRLAQIAAGHHGTIHPLNVRDMAAFGVEALVDSPSAPQQLAAARNGLWDVLDRSVGPVPDRLRAVPLMAASTLLAVVVLADWLASDIRLIEAQADKLAGSGDLYPEAHCRRAHRLASALIDGCGLAAPGPRPSPTPHTMLGRPEAAWTPLQASVAEGFAPTGPGIIAISAPTGEGKTEAALIAAHKLAAASGRHGFFFAVPTVAAAEAIHGRLDGYLGRSAPAGAAPALRRVHSQAMLYDNPEAESAEAGGPVSDGPGAESAAVSDGPGGENAEADGAVSDDPGTVRAAARWMRGACKPMVAPFGVGTADQLVAGAMKARHSPVRMLAAALGCVIVDDAHALDPYMRHLLARTVEWLAALGAPVVILSAAMPAARTAELFAAYQKGANSGQPASCGPPRAGGYPMWAAWTAADGPVSSADSGVVGPARSWDVRFDTAHVPAPAVTRRIAESAVAAAGKGLCVLVVRSTVRAAQDTYDQVRRLDPALAAGDTVEIVHSRMPHRARRDRTEQLADRLGPDAEARPDRLVAGRRPARRAAPERVLRFRRHRPGPHARPLGPCRTGAQAPAAARRPTGDRCRHMAAGRRRELAAPVAHLCRSRPRGRPPLPHRQRSGAHRESPPRRARHHRKSRPPRRRRPCRRSRMRPRRRPRRRIRRLPFPGGGAGPPRRRRQGRQHRRELGHPPPVGALETAGNAHRPSRRRRRQPRRPAARRLGPGGARRPTRRPLAAGLRNRDRRRTRQPSPSRHRPGLLRRGHTRRLPAPRVGRRPACRSAEHGTAPRSPARSYSPTTAPPTGSCEVAYDRETGLRITPKAAL